MIEIIWLGGEACEALVVQINHERVNRGEEDVEPEIELEMINEHGGVYVTAGDAHVLTNMRRHYTALVACSHREISERDRTQDVSSGSSRR